MKIKKLEIDGDGDTSLHLAAKNGNTRHLRTFVALGVDVNATNHYGWSPLMFAVKNCQLKSIRTLVYLGANLSQRDKYGYCSLCLAASTGDLEIVRYLLKKRLKRGETLTDIQKPVSPLLIAMIYGHLQIIKFLIIEKFKLDACSDFEGITPMYVASVKANKDVLDLLRHFGYNLPLKRSTKRQNSCDRLLPTNLEYKPTQNVLQIPIIKIDSPLPDSPIPFVFSPAPKIRKLEENLKQPKSFYENIPKGNRSKSTYNTTNFNFEDKEIFDYEDNDDVFLNYSEENQISEEWESNNKQFVKLLRHNSLDSYMSVFQKHEVDLDIFANLTDKDLLEIGVEKKNKNRMLKLGHQLRKQGFGLTVPEFY